ncbi:MAG TPA: SCO family protein [Acidobacteriaceae bacterium]|nr:SCO family protein [Acidobacteriaceae bacterium]
MRRGVAGAALALALVAGCKRENRPPATSNTATQAELKTYPIRGKIISVDAKSGSIVLSHEAIPGFMGAMTMTYPLKQPSIASELHPGDLITATLEVQKDGEDYTDPKLDQIVVVAQARPDYKPAVSYHVPQPGDAVPDFRFRNQYGHTIDLKQYKGKVVLLTFIYTRCPLADYCPRMNKNFAAIDAKLKGDPTLYRQTHLLSISFDPAYDTPAVLKTYGEIYNGGDDKEFAHWEFAAPQEKDLPVVEQFFDVGVTPGESGTFNHSLSTAVIGKDGKVRAWYPSNDWSPTDVLAQMKSAAAA